MLKRTVPIGLAAAVVAAAGIAFYPKQPQTDEEIKIYDNSSQADAFYAAGGANVEGGDRGAGDRPIIPGGASAESQAEEWQMPTDGEETEKNEQIYTKYARENEFVKVSLNGVEYEIVPKVAYDELIGEFITTTETTYSDVEIYEATDMPIEEMIVVKFDNEENFYLATAVKAAPQEEVICEY